MNLKEINSKAGSISGYLGYILLLFAWYVINFGYTMVIPESSGASFQLVSWGIKLLVGPILYAVVYGGIYERQTTQNELERKSFFSHIKLHALRFFGANLFSIFFYYIVLVVVLIIAGEKATELEDSHLFPAILTASSSTLMFFWFCAMVVEPKLWRSLIHAIKTLLFNPVALAIGIVWSVVNIADFVAFDFNTEQVALVINFARSGVLALLKVSAAMHILVIYKNSWEGQIQRVQVADILAAPSKPRTGERLAKVSLAFTFFSFLPLLHLVSLILGMISLKSERRFSLKAAVACCVGGFFTILYALTTLGYFAGQTSTVRLPGYSFLTERNAEIQPYVDLLDQGAFEDARTQLGNSFAKDNNLEWTNDTVLALAKYQDNDLDGALENFSSALQKKPERSEFYFYYGLALLDNNNAKMAKEQFQLALDHEPKLEIAERYLSLIQNTYQLNKVGQALIYLVILFFLFTVHEFGHAYGAWKLGDDTAKNQGRLTLNPIVHLDLFGSILLPALLLFQQSDVLFGWAKPVPIDTRNFKNPDKDHMLVSFAGPAVNLMVAMACMLILVSIVLLTRLLWPETLSLNLVDPYVATSMTGPPFSRGILFFIVFLKQMFYTSLILGIFNLLPIPPLDGSWILASFLPEKLRGIFGYARRFGFILFILLMLTPVMDYYLGIPIGIAWIGLKWIVSAMGFG